MKKIIFIVVLVYTNSFTSELSIIQQACDNKIATACYELGLLYEKGIGTKKNLTKAKDYYIKACQNGYDKACDSSETPLPEE